MNEANELIDKVKRSNMLNQHFRYNMYPPKPEYIEIVEELLEKHMNGEINFDSEVKQLVNSEGAHPTWGDLVENFKLECFIQMEEEC